jgi:Zn-dependent peptidase ImmA (M78 family)
MAKKLAFRSIFNRPNPPRVATILHRKVKVRVVSLLCDNEEGDLLGAWDANTGTIFLVKSDPNWRFTLLHEVCHAVLSISGANQFMTRKTEEQIVMAMENCLGPLVIDPIYWQR